MSANRFDAARFESRHLVVVALLCFACSLPLASCNGVTEVVNTQYGPVQGNLLEFTDSDAPQGTVNEFLGVPYAVAERWKSPGPPASWTQVRSATEFSERCVQYSNPKGIMEGSEDCLYLNVWTPQIPSGSPSQQLLPVMIWIHGGGFIEGTAMTYLYNGSLIASRQSNVVVVSMNYRLNVFGFLALSELQNENSRNPSTGNYGLEDQRAAMQWVQENIAAFGGDPNKVTLFGESAGGISVCLHMMSPLSSSLFHSAIIESGNCETNAATVEMVQPFGVSVLSGINCVTGGVVDLECARASTASALTSANVAAGGAAILSYANATGTLNLLKWSPIVDGWNIIEAPLLSLTKGVWNKVPVIIGANLGSMSVFVFSEPTVLAVDTWSEVDKAVDSFLQQQMGLLQAMRPGVSLHSPQVQRSLSRLRSYYTTRSNFPTAREALVRILSDGIFHCGTRRMAQYMSASAPEIGVYYYSFQHMPSIPPPPIFPTWLGAYHYAEVQYVFGVPNCFGISSPECVPQFTVEEENMSRGMQGYWISMALSGRSPNAMNSYRFSTSPSSNLRSNGTLHWPPYTLSTRHSLNISLSLSVATDIYDYICPVWDELLTAPSQLFEAGMSKSLPAGESATLYTLYTGERDGEIDNDLSAGAVVGIVVAMVTVAAVVLYVALRGTPRRRVVRFGGERERERDETGEVGQGQLQAPLV